MNKLADRLIHFIDGPELHWDSDTVGNFSINLYIKKTRVKRGPDWILAKTEVFNNLSNKLPGRNILSESWDTSNAYDILTYEFKDARPVDIKFLIEGLKSQYDSIDKSVDAVSIGY